MRRGQSAPSIGEVRLGDYEPLVQLAAGGMANVYVARKVGAAGFEKLVVIKRVHRHLLHNREFRDMFRDEARLCSTVRHPNVVPVLDVIELRDELLLVFEYVESISLSALVKAARQAEEPIDASVVSRIFVDVLAGLHAAHEAVDLRSRRVMIVHRDVSPQNIIVGRDGSSRLIDFGIAKATARISDTNSGVLKGKLSYMSPEQLRRRVLDRRSDVFAAGVVLHEALTGRRLFAGDDEGSIVLAILAGEVPAPSALRYDLPPALDAVLEKALARDRDERFQTALAFQEALEATLRPAPARDVTRLVERHAGEELRGRHAELELALHATPLLPAADVARLDAPIAGLAPGAGTVVMPSRSVPSRPGARRSIVITSVAIATVALAVVMVARQRSANPAVTATPAAEPTRTGVEPAEATPQASPIVETRAGNAQPEPAAQPPAPPRRRERQRQPPPAQELHRRNPYAP